MIAFYQDKIIPTVSKAYQLIKMYLLKSLKFILPIAVILFVFFPTTMFQIIGGLLLIVVSIIIGYYLLKIAIKFMIVLVFSSFYLVGWVLGFIFLVGGLAWVIQLLG